MFCEAYEGVRRSKYFGGRDKVSHQRPPFSYVSLPRCSRIGGLPGQLRTCLALVVKLQDNGFLLGEVGMRRWSEEMRHLFAPAPSLLFPPP